MSFKSEGKIYFAGFGPVLDSTFLIIPALSMLARSRIAYNFIYHLGAYVIDKSDLSIISVI
jgi:hypothetical protein